MSLLSRRNFLYGLGGVTLAGMAGCVYATEIEPHSLDITHKKIDIGLAKKGIPPILVAHLSDLHNTGGDFHAFLRKTFETTIALKPDVIFITGDFITRKLREPAPYADALKILAPAAPTFACYGNHDTGNWSRRYYISDAPFQDGPALRQLISQAGIRLLVNESVVTTIKGQSIRISGMGDIYSSECRPKKTFANVEPSSPLPHIILSHNPDSKIYLRDYPWDLMLCGHTHGGQIKIPFRGPLILPIKDKAFGEGLFFWENRHIHVTRGIGAIAGIRINCPPEISMLQLI